MDKNNATFLLAHSVLYNHVVIIQHVSCLQSSFAWLLRVEI